jgi:hypothetical protein
LYRAKEDGRNRVVFAGVPESVKSPVPPASAAVKSTRAKSA